MKLLLVVVFLTAVILAVEAIPAGYYPEHQEEVELHEAEHVAAPVVVDHHDHHHVSPLLTHVISKVAHGVAYLAPHVTHAVGAFLSSSSGHYDHH